jgi:tRNA(adenine34) deaminase
MEGGNQIGFHSAAGLAELGKRYKGAMEAATNHELWMERLLRRADRLGALGEVPVAAVVLDGKGRAVGWGSNRRHHGQDPLGHAELVALRQAAMALGTWRLNLCTLLVTLEPCPMCAGALIQARMGTVVFAAADPKRGALGGCLNLASDGSAHHRLQVVSGLKAREAEEQLKAWFRRRRQQRERYRGNGEARFRGD